LSQLSERQHLAVENHLAEERDAAVANLSELAFKLAQVEEKNRCTAEAWASLSRVLDLQAGELQVGVLKYVNREK
jgi:hypothetical protein